ncbi:hypothetical protein RclHR1_00590022 [Rhizophagus clarus]|uniref:Uncharacterized protein n=1 Tax=Rhizophagus clarus TaxID=94130 RepID=A0A2Z6RPN7_9GLOM|nr:hypothetical protein RclHR1_00590022 [Rhizophagus clarus]GES92480.1 hypothetical protein GLOIN_2v1873713 [Rhizophagus clarus]
MNNQHGELSNFLNEYTNKYGYSTNNIDEYKRQRSTKHRKHKSYTDINKDNFIHNEKKQNGKSSSNDDSPIKYEASPIKYEIASNSKNCGNSTSISGKNYNNQQKQRSNGNKFGHSTSGQKIRLLKDQCIR